MRIILTLADGRLTSMDTNTIMDIVEMDEKDSKPMLGDGYFTAVYRIKGYEVTTAHGETRPIIVKESVEEITHLINGTKP